MPSLPLTGGCHCGALRYEITQAPSMIYNCHCTNCQKIGGGAFATSAAIRESAFAFTKGQPGRIEWTSEAGNLRFGWFCRDCGSRIAHGQVESSRTLSLRGGTLDDTSWIYPVGDIWTRSAQPWVKFVEGGVHAERQPTDYGPFAKAFRAQNNFPD
ncbi:MAG: GFA family protein [Hyphomonadaceae bacterium]